MSSLRILLINFEPGRRKEYAGMIAMTWRELIENRLAGKMLKSGCGVNDAAIKEHAGRCSAGGGPVRKSHGESAAQEGERIQPGERRTTTCHFFADDSPTGLFHDGVSAPG